MMNQQEYANQLAPTMVLNNAPVYYQENINPMYQMQQQMDGQMDLQPMFQMDGMDPNMMMGGQMQDMYMQQPMQLQAPMLAGVPLLQAGNFNFGGAQAGLTPPMGLETGGVPLGMDNQGGFPFVFYPTDGLEGADVAPAQNDADPMIMSPTRPLGAVMNDDESAGAVEEPVVKTRDAAVDQKKKKKSALCAFC